VDRILQPLLASLLLGLAPFAPEPHIVGKLRWVAGGAVGMGPMDWFDLVLHGAPWVWLVVTVASVGWGKLKSSGAAPTPAVEPSAAPARKRSGKRKKKGKRRR